MQTLLVENRRLKEIIQRCQNQIIQLKKIGNDHQQQIDSLLKFNERLLSIIQNQMPSKALSRTSSGSNLHPIDQATNQKQQQLLSPHLTQKVHPIKDKIEHVDPIEIQKLSQQNQDAMNNLEQAEKNYYNNLKNHNNGNNLNIDPGYFRQVQSYSSSPNQRPQILSGRDSNENYPQGVIFREEKQSLIQIPKLFKLQKGLNDHYHKELFQSIEQNRRFNPIHSDYPINGHFGVIDNKQGQQDPAMMYKISQAVTQRFLLSNSQLVQQIHSIKNLIQEYKQDFDTNEYIHLCTIIKNDLQGDLQQLVSLNAENMNFYSKKQKQIQQLLKKIKNLNPTQKLLEIIERLDVNKETQSLLIQKIIYKSQK